MKVQPSRTIRLFEVFFLRPLNIVLLLLAVVFLAETAWILTVAMALCCLFVGAIGQALPHRKAQTFSELARGSAVSPHDDELSNENSFALAKATMRIAIVVGFAVFVLAWRSRLGWYWVLLWAICSYFVTAISGALLPALIGARKARSDEARVIPDSDRRR